jgi:hypothetical protein
MQQAKASRRRTQNLNPTLLRARSRACRAGHQSEHGRYGRPLSVLIAPVDPPTNVNHQFSHDIRGKVISAHTLLEPADAAILTPKTAARTRAALG